MKILKDCDLHPYNCIIKLSNLGTDVNERKELSAKALPNVRIKNLTVNMTEGKIPARYKIPLWDGIKKPIRKWFSAVVIPTIPFNNLRVSYYRLACYKIDGTFIGMRCYLDDLCYDKIEIGKNVTISYGVYFACHGRKQGHNKIVIKDGAYIGMRASIIAPKGDVVIGEKAIIGTMTLVNKSVPAGSTAVGVPCRILEKKAPNPVAQEKNTENGNIKE